MISFHSVSHIKTTKLMSTRILFDEIDLSFTSTDLKYTSAVAHHAHTTGHTIDFKSTHILSSLTKSSQLDIIEHAAIKIISPSLNKLHSASNINNQWTDLLPTIKNSFRPRLAYPPLLLLPLASLVFFFFFYIIDCHVYIFLVI